MKKNYRKIFGFIVLSFFFFFCPFIVKAEGKASTGFKINGKPYLGETFDVILYVNDVTGTTNDDGLAAFGGHFYYDTERLELVDYESLAPFFVQFTNSTMAGIATNYNYINEYHEIIKFTFRVKELGNAIINYPENKQPDSKANPVYITGCKETLTITERPSPLTIDETSIYVLTNKTKKLTASYNLEGTVTGFWSSENPSVASIDQNGNVTGVSPGITKVAYQTSNGYRVECEVTVSNYLKGDVNRDGKVTLADAMEVIYFYVQRKKPTEYSYAAGDMNEDGKLNLSDAILIINIYLEK